MYLQRYPNSPCSPRDMAWVFSDISVRSHRSVIKIHRLRVLLVIASDTRFIGVDKGFAMLHSSHSASCLGGTALATKLHFATHSSRAGRSSKLRSPVVAAGFLSRFGGQTKGKIAKRESLKQEVKIRMYDYYIVLKPRQS